LTALNAGSLVLSWRAFGYAFLEVCLHLATPRFSGLKHARLISFPVPLCSATALPSPRALPLRPPSSAKVGIQNP
jgi:hypothetical protein